MRATLKTSVIARLLPLLFCAFTLLCAASPGRAATTNFIAQAESAYKAAQAVRATNANDLNTLIDVARTAFDFADIVKTDDQRESIAIAGIDAARAAISKNSNSVAAHYYLALDLGQLARTKMLGALKILQDMEAALKRTIELDAKFDYAGGHRTIGVLYLEAPGWPTSVGNKNKARFHLTQALTLAPEFPDNHICLMEALLKWHDWNLLHEKITAYQFIIPAAKTNFTGADWDYEWSDWERRFQNIQSKAKKP
jgi:hypothetical protein